MLVLLRPKSHRVVLDCISVRDIRYVKEFWSFLMFWNFSLNSYWKLGGKMLDCELRGWRAERVQPSHLACFFLTRAVFAINLAAFCPNLRFSFVFAGLKNNFASHTRGFPLCAAFLFFSFCIQTVDWSSWVCISQILSEFCLFRCLFDTFWKFIFSLNRA